MENEIIPSKTEQFDYMEQQCSPEQSHNWSTLLK